LIELFGKEREVIEPLCRGREEEVTIYGTMEGHMGKVWVDKRQLPECAVVLAGDFFFLLGSCIKSEEEAIVQILSEHQDCIIILDDQIWAPLLEKLSTTYPESYKSFLRYAMNGNMEWFEKEKLKSFIERVPPEFILQRIDATVFELTKKDEWSEDFCSNFQSVEEFEESGIGYVMLHEGEIVAGASTYGYCKGKIEIQIETKKEFRRRGLALACGAKLILECLEKNIYPRWDAANLDSVALAEKLGYRFSHEYQVYSI
jgi:GNAT superfamily N-acetyltransferase